MNNFFQFIDFSIKENPINQLFGPPPYLSEEGWPENNNEYLHHLISISLNSIHTSLQDDIVGISIFMMASYEDRGDFFSVRKIYAKDLTSKPKIEYPENYNKWWDEEYEYSEYYKCGRNFGLKILDKPTREEVSKVMNNTLESFEVIENELRQYAIGGSYLGGFPIWSQSEETPKDSNGQNMTFLMKINGSNVLFAISPIEDVNIFFFYDSNNQFQWVIQS